MGVDIYQGKRNKHEEEAEHGHNEPGDRTHLVVAYFICFSIHMLQASPTRACEDVVLPASSITQAFITSDANGAKMKCVYAPPGDKCKVDGVDRQARGVIGTIGNGRVIM